VELQWHAVPSREPGGPPIEGCLDIYVSHM